MTDYSNLRRNPFTAAYSYRAMDPESHTVAEFDEFPGVYGFQLQDKPEQGSVVITEDVSGGAELTEVLVAPLSGQFRVDYVAGYVAFNIADNGMNVVVDYNGGGTNASLESLTKIINVQDQIDVIDAEIDDLNYDLGVIQADVSLKLDKSAVNDDENLGSSTTDPPSQRATKAYADSVASPITAEEKITAQAGGFWGDVVWKDADEVVIKCKAADGLTPFHACVLNDGTFVKSTSDATIKLAAPGSSGHILDGITAALNNEWYIIWGYKDSGGLLAYGFTWMPNLLLDTADPTNALTPHQVNSQDVCLLVPVGAHLCLFQDSDEWETPLAWQNAGAVTYDATKDKPKVSSRTSTVITLGANLENNNFTHNTIVYQVDGFKPVAVDDGLIVDVIGARGYKDTGIRLRTDGSANILPFRIKGKYFCFENGNGSDDYSIGGGTNGVEHIAPGAYEVYKLTHVPVDKNGIFWVYHNASAEAIVSPYYMTYGESVGYGAGAYDCSPLTVIHGLLRMRARSGAPEINTRGYII